MTSKDMKLIKFEATITELWKKFGSYKFDKYDNKNPLKYLFGEKSNNKYGQIILDKSFNDKVASKRAGYGNCIYRWKNDTVKELVDACRFCNKSCTYGINSFEASCNLSSQLIFFALLFIAVDNDSYNEKVNIISDMAYLIEFNAEMISVWIYAVKAILEVKKIDFNQFKTEEAKKFFKVLN